MRYLKRSQPVCYLFCLKIKYAITDRFTKENAINVLKFITEAINSKSGPIANSETAPVKTIVNTGVRNFGWTYPKNLDRKSTRLNSSHVSISYAVFCLKKKIHSTTCIPSS